MPRSLCFILPLQRPFHYIFWDVHHRGPLIICAEGMPRSLCFIFLLQRSFHYIFGWHAPYTLRGQEHGQRDAGRTSHSV